MATMAATDMFGDALVSVQRQPLTLNVTVLRVEGRKVRRKQLSILDVNLSTDISSFKRTVGSLLGAPSTFDGDVLVDDRATVDQAALSEYSVHADSRILVVAWHPKQSTAPVHEELLEDADLMAGVPADTYWPDDVSPLARGLSFDPTASDLACDISLLPDVRSPREHMPPPLLMRKSCRRLTKTPENLCTVEEQALVDAGHLYLLPVHAMILLGQHAHQRACLLPASEGSVVGDLEERLVEWLGSQPDELELMTANKDSLDSNTMLGEHCLGGAGGLAMVAWYKHAREEHRLQCPHE